MGWIKVDSDHWVRMQDSFMVGGIYPADDGGLKAWVWPLGQGSKSFISGTFISSSRAKEAIENVLDDGKDL